MEETEHWIATALINGEVLLFDSCFDGKLLPSAELQIAQMYRPLIASNGLLLTVVPIQQQKSGSNNCGLFAIAAAYHVAKGDDLGSLTLDEDKLRSHLARCFENEKLRRFPKAKHPSAQRPERHQHIAISIFCPCLRPDSFDEMIQCDKCDSWHHFRCVSIKVAPMEEWYCHLCR